MLLKRPLDQKININFLKENSPKTTTKIILISQHWFNAIKSTVAFRIHYHYVIIILSDRILTFLYRNTNILI